MKSGFGSILIDGEKIVSCSNLICFITPGRQVKIDFSNEPEGWILQFNKEFLNGGVSHNMLIKEAELLSMFGEIPKIILSPKIGERVHGIAQMIDELNGSLIPNKEYGIAALFKSLLVYCDSRCNIRLNDMSEKNIKGIELVAKYKELVVDNYTKFHKVSKYADMLNVSPKQLNRVVKEIMGVNAKSIITEQLIIHARRELKFSGKSVKQIAYTLGFSEPFHFSSYFKRETGVSPSKFRLQ